MRKEKIILLFAATLIGLLVAGVAFYIYQSTKVIPTTKIKKVSVKVPTPTPKPSIFLSISSPTPEQVFDKKVITVTGKTSPDAKIIVVGPIDQSSGTASSEGDFSTTINLDTDQNIISITAIASNGETITVKRVVTYSTENF